MNADDRRLRNLTLAAALAALLLLSSPCFSASVTKTLAEGVVLSQDINTSPQSPLVVNVLRVNPKAPGVKLAAALGQDGVIEPDATQGREKVSAMVARKGALAGINADFFPFTGDPLGVAIVGGELVSEPTDRAAMGITASGEVLFDKLTFKGTMSGPSGAALPVKGLNRPRGKNEIVLYTRVFGAATEAKEGVEATLSLDGPVRQNVDIQATVTCDPTTACGGAIPAEGAVLSAGGPTGLWILQNLHKGDRLKLRLDVRAASGRSWDGVVEAVGGGPWLVRGGEAYIDGEEEQFKPDLVARRHPRTAAGVTASGELLLVTVDGRQFISAGVSLSELAALMKSLGAVDAINLDGGGSTTLSARGIVVNSPSAGAERPVADGVLVYAPPPARASAQIRFADAGTLLISSGPGRMILLLDDSGAPVSEEVAAAVVWGTMGGIGFVNQQGYFTPVRIGTGSIVALFGDRRIELPVTVVPCAPANIAAAISPDPSGAPNRGVVTATLTDANGNPVAAVEVTIAVTGGTADAAKTTTGDKGTATFAVTWDSTPDAASVTVTAAGLTAAAK